VTCVAGLLCDVIVVNNRDCSIVGVFIEPIRQEIWISETQIGLMMGCSFCSVA
jgi:hypothetical protein